MLRAISNLRLEGNKPDMDSIKMPQKQDLRSRQLELNTCIFVCIFINRLSLIYDSHDFRLISRVQITDQEVSQRPPQASPVHPG